MNETPEPTPWLPFAILSLIVVFGAAVLWYYVDGDGDSIEDIPACTEFSVPRFSLTVDDAEEASEAIERFQAQGWGNIKARDGYYDGWMVEADCAASIATSGGW